MVDYSTLSIVLTGLGIMGAIVYYTLNLRNATTARQAQVYAQIWDKFSSPEYLERYFETMDREWTDWDDYVEKYGSLRYSNRSEYAKNMSVGVYYEGIGVLLKNGFIDAQPVADLLGTTVISFWEKVATLIMEWRVRNRDPRGYLYVEYLYNQIKPIIEREHPELRT